ncbi:MAG TPA: serine hydrolase domain-containing protein [Rubricoccaceae bacterium]|jgi:CubicO group peptidase (beta-lactamase class C family)
MSVGRLCLLPLALLVGCGTLPAPPDAVPITGPPADLPARLDGYLRGRVADGYSGVVLVAQNGEVVFHRAYSRDRALTPETAFWIGSVSKTLTAAAVLRLRDEGRLSLSDPITRFLDDIPADKRAITVRQLLTHTAGLGEHYAADGITDRDGAVQAILARPLERAPGAGYGYTGDAYNLLAAIVEVASEEPFETYLREAVLRPAGMVNTGFWGEPNPSAVLAAAGRATSTAPNWGFRGATGLSSTAGDLYRWHLALLADTVLAESTRQEAFAPQVEKPGGGAYGYGWQVTRTPRGTTLVSHGGAESGLGHYAGMYQYIDEDVVVIALSNATEDEAQETLRGVLRMLFPR